MKKFFLLVMAIFIVNMPIKAYAINDNVVVNVEVNGELKQGNIIDINFKVNDVENFYGIQLEYNYDPNSVEVLEVTRGAFIDSTDQNVYEPFKDINKDRNLARYAATFTGDYKGLKGTGIVCSMKIKINSGNSINISSKNTSIKIVERTKDNRMVAMKYKLNGIGNDAEGEGSSSGSNGNNSDTSGTNTKPDSNSSVDSNKSDESDSNEKIEEDKKVENDKNENVTSSDKTDEKVEDETNKNDDIEAVTSESTSYKVIATVLIIALVGSVSAYYIYKKKK